MVMRPIVALALFILSFSVLSQVALAQVNVTVHTTTLNVSTPNQYLNITVGNGDVSWNRNVTDVVIFFPGPAEFKFVNGSNFTTASDASFVTYPPNYFQVSWNNTTSIGIIPHGSSRNFSIRINTPASAGDHTVSVFTYFSNNATPEVTYKTINLVQPPEVKVESGILVVDTTFPNTLEMGSNDPSIFHINGAYYVFYDTGQGSINYTTSLNGTKWNPPRNATSASFLTTQLTGAAGVYWNSTDFILVKKVKETSSKYTPMIKMCRPSADSEVLSCGREVFNPKSEAAGWRLNVIELKDPNIETVLFSYTDPGNSGVWGIWNISDENISVVVVYNWTLNGTTNITTNESVSIVKSPGNFTTNMRLSTIVPAESAPQWAELNDTAAVVFYPIYDGANLTEPYGLFERVYRHGFGLGSERQILSSGNGGVIRPVLDSGGNLYVAYKNILTKTIHVLYRDAQGGYGWSIDTKVLSDSATAFVNTTMSIDRASGTLFLFHGNASGIFMSNSTTSGHAQSWTKEIKIASLLGNGSAIDRGGIGAQTNESTNSTGHRIIPLMWEEAGKIVVHTYVTFSPPPPPPTKINSVSQNSTSFRIYNESLTIEANITSQVVVKSVNITVYNSTFNLNISAINSAGNGTNGNWSKTIKYDNPFQYLYPGNYSFYVTAYNESSALANSSIYSFALLNNKQSMFFEVPSWLDSSLIVRKNTTSDVSILEIHVWGDNFAGISPFNFTVSNSTYSFDIQGKYASDSSKDCRNVISGVASRQNKQTLGCRFSIPHNLSANLYNLSFKTTDIFGNAYTPSTEFKVTSNVVSIKTFSFGGELTYLNDTNNTNTSLLINLNQNEDFPASVSIAYYNETPGIPAYDPFNTSRFVEFIPSNTFEETSNHLGRKDWFWVEIRIHYTDEQIATLGLSESDLRLKFYNETTNSWETCSGSNANTAANYVYCNSTHFSTWSISVEPASGSSPSSSSSTSSSGGGGGGSGGSGTAVSTSDSASDTKTVQTEETSESPEANEIGTGTTEESAPTRNATNERQENLVTGLFALGGANTLSVILAVIIVGGITSFLLWRKTVGVRKKS